MSLSIPLKNQFVNLSARSEIVAKNRGISSDLPGLDSESLFDVIKSLATQHENGTLDDEAVKGVLKLTIGQYVEDEIDRRLAMSFEYKFTKNRFLNFLL